MMLGHSIIQYAHGSVRGPLVYYKHPGILRLQWLRRGVLVVWWWR